MNGLTAIERNMKNELQMIGMLIEPKQDVREMQASRMVHRWSQTQIKDNAQHVGV